MVTYLRKCFKKRSCANRSDEFLSVWPCDSFGMYEQTVHSVYLLRECAQMLNFFAYLRSLLCSTGCDQKALAISSPYINGNLEKPTARASLAPVSLALHKQSCVSRHNICTARYGFSKSPNMSAITNNRNAKFLAEMRVRAYSAQQSEVFMLNCSCARLPKAFASAPHC